MTEIRSPLPIEEFIGGMSAAVQLYNRERESGAFFESICLAASLVDAACRMGLVLNRQIATKSQVVEDDLVTERRQILFRTRYFSNGTSGASDRSICL